MISKEQYLKNYEVRDEVIQKYLNEEYKKDYNTILYTTDLKERERALQDLESIRFYYNNFKEEQKLNQPEQLRLNYKDMEDMVDALNKAFTCNWVSETELEVITKHEDLSDFAYMLQDWFGVKSTSGFTFGSSFTEHQGKTKNGLYLRITISEKGFGLIRFCMEPGYPYYIPDEIKK